MESTPGDIWNLIFEHLRLDDTKVFTLRMVCKRFKFLISNYVYNTKFLKLKETCIEKALLTDFLSWSDRIEVIIGDDEKEYNIATIEKCVTLDKNTNLHYSHWIYDKKVETSEEPESLLKDHLRENKRVFDSKFDSNEYWGSGHMFRWGELLSTLTSALTACKPISKLGIKGIIYMNGSRVQRTVRFTKDTENHMEFFNHGMYYLCCAIEKGTIKP